MTNTGFLDAVTLKTLTSLISPEEFAPGTTICAEGELGKGICVLLDGEVELRAQGKVFDRISPGEIFGEIEAIAQAPRASSVVAKSASRAIGLDSGQFRSALQREPALALAIIGAMAAHLPGMIKRILSHGTPNIPPARAEFPFERTLQQDLVHALSRKPVHYTSPKTIIDDPVATRTMYVVFEGRVAFTRKDVHGDFVQHNGPGGVVGETALIDGWPSKRIAVACPGCALLAIDRDAFLYLVRTKTALGIALLAGIAERGNYLAR